MRILTGKKNRDQAYFIRRFREIIGLSPSFYLVVALTGVIRAFKVSWPALVKVKVPKYGYQAYCPMNKHDFLNMTIREEDLLELFVPNQGDTVIDLGAHAGRYSIISSIKVGNKGKVIAIEPDPQTFLLLKRNLALNKLSNVMTLNCAVYSANQKVKLYVSGNSFGTSLFHSVIPARGQYVERFTEVQAYTLDYLLNSNGIVAGDIRWIKIDVEGAEYQVLKGSIDTLSNSRDLTILIEIHNFAKETNQYEPIMELLSIYNFKILLEKVYEGGERHLLVRRSVK